MSTLSYLGLKTIVTGLRLLQPCPVSPHPDKVLQLPSRDDNRTIKAHVYQSDSPKAPSPVLLNFHGSGFVLPWHGSDDAFCRVIAQKTKYTVLDIQYRLAPENPFPAALNDVEDAIKYVLSHPETYDATRVSISGFSAGGNMALAVLSLAAIPPNTIHSIIVFYPPMDISIKPGDKVQADPSGPNVIPTAGAKLFNVCYTGKENRKDPLVSPAFMDISRLPKEVLLITCAYDTLALETERFAEKVQKEVGKEMVLVCKRIGGVSHAWDKSCKAGSEGEKKRDEAYNMAVNMLKG